MYGNFQERYPNLLSLSLSSTIAKHKDFGIELVVEKEMQMLQKCNDFLKFYDSLDRLISTQLILPLVHMIKSLLFLWLLTLPFTLIDDISSKWTASSIAFALTYVFLGLEFVDRELGHPFGEDDNNYKIRNISETVCEDILYFLYDIDGKDGVDLLRKGISDTGSFKNQDGLNKIKFTDDNVVNVTLKGFNTQSSFFLKTNSDLNIFEESREASTASIGISAPSQAQPGLPVMRGDSALGAFSNLTEDIPSVFETVTKIAPGIQAPTSSSARRRSSLPAQGSSPTPLPMSPARSVSDTSFMRSLSKRNSMENGCSVFSMKAVDSEDLGSNFMTGQRPSPSPAAATISAPGTRRLSSPPIYQSHPTLPKGSPPAHSSSISRVNRTVSYVDPTSPRDSMESGRTIFRIKGESPAGTRPFLAGTAGTGTKRRNFPLIHQSRPDRPSLPKGSPPAYPSSISGVNQTVSDQISVNPIPSPRHPSQGHPIPRHMPSDSMTGGRPRFGVKKETSEESPFSAASLGKDLDVYIQKARPGYDSGN